MTNPNNPTPADEKVVDEFGDWAINNRSFLIDDQGPFYSTGAMEEAFCKGLLHERARCEAEIEHYKRELVAESSLRTMDIHLLKDISDELTAERAKSKALCEALESAAKTIDTMTDPSSLKDSSLIYILETLANIERMRNGI